MHARPAGQSLYVCMYVLYLNIHVHMCVGINQCCQTKDKPNLIKKKLNSTDFAKCIELMALKKLDREIF